MSSDKDKPDSNEIMPEDHLKGFVDNEFVIVDMEKAKKELEEKKKREAEKAAKPKATEEEPKPVLGTERLMNVVGFLEAGYEFHAYKKRKLFFHKRSQSYHTESEVIDYLMIKISEAFKMKELRRDPTYDIDDRDMRRGMAFFTRNPKDAVQLNKLIELREGEERWALHSYDYQVKKGDSPTWDKIMGRMGNAKAFEAFLWSVFQDDSSRFQYCYLYGEGNTGKSTLTQFLQKKLNGAACHTSVDCLRSRFFIGQNMYRRLIVITESGSNFTKSSEFKSLSGDSNHLADIKFKDPVSVQVEYKFIFTSNDMPDIGDNTQDRRRIIYCPMGVFSGPSEHKNDVLAALELEWPAILFKCQESYNQMTQPDGNIAVGYDEIDIETTDEVAGFEDLFTQVFALVRYDQLPKDQKQYARMTKAEIIRQFRMAQINRKIPGNFTDNEVWQLFRKSKLLCSIVRQTKVVGKRYWSGLCLESKREENQFQPCIYYPRGVDLDDLF